MADSLLEVEKSWTFAFKASRQALAENVDAPRFRAAMKELLPKVREWPSPAEILDLLPPRPPQARLTEAPPELTEEERQENLHMLRECLQKLSGGMTITDKTHNEKARLEAHTATREG